MTASRILPRRCFLGTAAAALAAAAVPLPVLGRARLPDIAANAFGLRNHLIADFPGTLRTLRRIGFKRVELVSFKGWDGHPYGSFTALAGMSGEAVARALADAGLIATSSHVLPSELRPDAIAQTLEWMGPIGVKSLIIAGLPIANEAPDALVRGLEGLNETGRLLSAQGVRLLVHSDFAFWNPLAQGMVIGEFFRRVDPGLCKLQLDLGACLQMAADPVWLIRQYGAHIGSLHLRDAKPPFAATAYVPSVALGEGVAPLPEIMRAAREADISDFVLEMVMRPEGGELAALERSLSYLKINRAGDTP
jgi:sugar phosphate isomerase/epimerase